MNRLKLIALDKEDLAIVSTHCQDSIMKVGDLCYFAKENRFVLSMRRYVWDPLQNKNEHERRLSVLHINRVESVSLMNIDRNNPDQVLNLLAVTFEPEETPSGYVHLLFSDDATIRLKVECLEVQLADMKAAWQTRFKPMHVI